MLENEERVQAVHRSIPVHIHLRRAVEVNREAGGVQQRPLYDVMVHGDTGWIVGEAGTVLKTTDGGATWALEPLPIQLAARWLRSIWLTPGGRGLAVGAEGLVFRVDGWTLERLARAGGEPAS